MQAFTIVTGFGAKKKGGGELKPEDLWKMKSDVKLLPPMFKPGSPEYKDWYSNIQKKYKLK